MIAAIPCTATPSIPKLEKTPVKLASNEIIPIITNFVISEKGYFIASEKISPKLIFSPIILFKKNNTPFKCQ